MSLSLNDATVRLGEREWCFDATIASDARVAITGRSGSGKSTLLNLIAGFVAPVSGEVRWQERSLVGVDPADRPATMLFQQHNLFDHLSVADNVGLGLHPGLKLDSVQRERVDAVLHEVGLAGYGSRRPGGLSGGERQRVGLARCLLRERPILLLDEPFAALDASTRTAMLALTRRVIDRYRPCVLMVTHDADDAAPIGADTLHVENGRLVQVANS